MRTVRPCLASIAFAATLAALALPALAQSVVATHSGVIYYFDGAVYLGDQRLESHLGKFETIPQGAELRTAEGRAEVLLTPGVFLRMGELSALRMVSNDLSNTRVELESGSAIVDSSDASSSRAVTVQFHDWQIRSSEAGTYRIDSEPARLHVLRGSAKVTAKNGGEPLEVREGMALPFAAVLAPEPAEIAPSDNLSQWEQGRSDSIVADNAITQQIDGDPSTQIAGLDPIDGVTYFPYLGVPSLGVYSGAYGSLMPAQPGFYSMYLPGYTYQPLLIGIMGRGLGLRAPRVGAFPGPGVFTPGRSGLSPIRVGISSPRLGGSPGLAGGSPRLGGSPGISPIRTAPLPMRPAPVAAPAARPVIVRPPAIRR